MSYDIGDTARVTLNLTVDDTLSNPTALTAKVMTPRGVITTVVYGVDLALVRDSTGVYHLDVDCTEAGVWTVHFQATGTGKGAAEHSFSVRRGAFA